MAGNSTRERLQGLRVNSFENLRRPPVPAFALPLLELVVDRSLDELVGEGIVEARTVSRLTDQMPREKLVYRLENLALIPTDDLTGDVRIETRADDARRIEQKTRSIVQPRNARGYDRLQRQREGLTTRLLDTSDQLAKKQWVTFTGIVESAGDLGPAIADPRGERDDLVHGVALEPADTDVPCKVVLLEAAAQDP